MTKTQLINQVARKAKISKTAATQCVNACFGAIKRNTKTRTGCNISGFGKFWYDHTQNRVYNQRTGRMVTKKGPKKVCFKPAARW